MQLTNGEKLIKQWDYQKGNNAVSSLVLTDKRIVQETKTATSYRAKSHTLKNCEQISSSLTHYKPNKTRAVLPLLFGICWLVLGFVLSSKSSRGTSSASDFSTYLIILGVLAVVSGILMLIFLRDKYSLTLKVFEKKEEHDENPLMAVASSNGAVLVGVRMNVDPEVAQDMIDTIGALTLNHKEEE